MTKAILPLREQLRNILWILIPGPIAQRHNGVLISNAQGKSLAYALFKTYKNGADYLLGRAKRSMRE